MAKLFDRKPDDEQIEVIGNDVLDAPASLVSIDDRKHSRLGWWVVLVGVVGFLLWAGFAPLDRGVPAPGTVMVSGNRQAVQNLVGGVIDEILVREGSVVQRGDVLVRMNPTQARSEAETLRGQYHSLLAVSARLAAERDGASTIVFPAELLELRDDPRVLDAVALQRQLFESRRMALSSDLRATEESIAGLRAQIGGMELLHTSRQQQARFIGEQLRGMRSLASEGYVPRNRLLDLERTGSQLQGDMAEVASGIVRSQKQIAELELRMTQRRQEYQREVRTQLSETRREVESLRSRIVYADFELQHATVSAPASGVVVGLTVFTNGGIVSPGTQLMDIVPRDEPLMIEVRVPVHLIDKVHTGLPVEMMFTAFNQRNTPHIPGEVATVSADRLVDQHTGEPYYRVEARVTPEGKEMLAANEVRPGMPADVLIKLGERTMLNYLLRPILDRAGTALVQE